MKGTQVARIGATAMAAMLALQLFAGAASAAPPRWAMTVELLPPTVQNGENAGYRVTITNNGPSNISSLYLVDSTSASPTYVHSSRPGACTAANTVDLYCSFGALNAGDSVTVTLAYMTGSGSSFAMTFEANTGGATFSDKNQTSHGDTLKRTVSTALTSNRNFAGGFSLTGDVIADDQDLHPSKNKQATTVAPPADATYVPVTVQDGITTDLSSGACTGGFGEWSVVNVNNGQTYDDAFKVTITVIGNAVPNDFDPASVVVCHVNDKGIINYIGNIASERCDDADAPTNVAGEGCVISEFVGNNLKTTLWVFSNGGYRKV